MTFQKVTFQNEAGDKLSARIDFPVGERPAAFALFAHCFTCSKNLKAVGNISRALTSEGFAVLRLDFTGLGESEGNFAETNFSSNISDLLSAVRFLQEQFQGPALLIGHSLGGAAVLKAASQVEPCQAVATIGAPADPAHVRRLLKSSEDEIVETGEALVSLAGRPFKIKKQFLDDLADNSADNGLAQIGSALLVLHSPTDNIVGIENARKIFEDAKHPKSFISLDHADHLLTEESDSLFAGIMIANWAKKYLHLPLMPEEPKPLSDNLVEVRTGAEGYRTEIVANGHILVADEPLSVGGTNTGPTPYDYLAAALGACTSMTLRMYADHKKWPLEAIKVVLKHQKIHAIECLDCETKEGKIDEITRAIVLKGDLSNEQRQRLLEIADRCPVHRTLYSEMKIRTKLMSD